MAANNTLNRLSLAIGAAGLLALVGSGWLFVESRKHPEEDHQPAKVEKAESHAEEGHAEEKAGHGEEKEGHDAHGHGEASDLDRTVDELWAAKCEHNVENYQCDECRYEVGVVRIPSDMLSAAGNAGIVKTGTPSRMTFSEEFTVTGEVGFNQEKTAHAAAALSGMVRKIHVSVGDRVAAGAPLFEIDSQEVSDAKAAYRAARSDLEVEEMEARARFFKALSVHDDKIAEGRGAYQKALGGLALAMKSADREKKLFEKNISARSELEEAEARLLEARVEAANAQFTLMRQGVEEQVFADHLKAAGLAPADVPAVNVGQVNPSESYSEVAVAVASLYRLGMDPGKMTEGGMLKYDFRKLASLDANSVDKGREPKAWSEIANARARLLKLGLNEESIEALKKDGSDLSGLMTVFSPVSGVVVERHGASGEYAEAGKELISITDFNKVWVWANLRDEELSILRKAGGQLVADVLLPEGETLRGRVDLTSGTVDEETRNFRARVVLDNPGAVLRPGMFATVKMLVPGKSDGLAVPKAAVLTDEGRPFVFIHKEKEYWIRRPVTAGREIGGLVEIVEGLQPGQKILTDGSFVAKSDVLRSKMGAGCAD